MLDRCIRKSGIHKKGVGWVQLILGQEVSMRKKEEVVEVDR